jgi:hypothetical protein
VFAGGLLLELVPGEVLPGVVVDVELVPGAVLPLVAEAGGFALAAEATIGEALKLPEPPQPTRVSIMARKERVKRRWACIPAKLWMHQLWSDKRKALRLFSV